MIYRPHRLGAIAFSLAVAPVTVIDGKMMTWTTMNFAKWLTRARAIAVAIIFLFTSQSLTAQIVPKGATSPADVWSYTDIADVFSAAPIVAHVRIREAIIMKGATTRPGTIRIYLTGDIVSLIRAPSAIPPRITWLADVPLDSRGRSPKLKKASVLLAAVAVPNPAGSVRLITRDAMVPWSPRLEPRVRALLNELAAPDAVPFVTGISGAFHTAGTVAGEGETQIFLTATNGNTMSLNVLSRPGEPPRWSFAPGEIIDEAATAPKVDTLTWYRLACFLPQTLPANATADLAPVDDEAARTDYALVMESLGPCLRTRK